jgi:hypothetical protein
MSIKLPPTEIVHRVDGWIGAGADPSRIPEPIAELIERQATLDDTVETIRIRARMLQRHFGLKSGDEL